MTRVLEYAAFPPTAMVWPAIPELELDVEWVTPGVVMARPFEDGSAIAPHRDGAATADSLGGVAGAGRARGRALGSVEALGRCTIDGRGGLDVR